MKIKVIIGIFLAVLIFIVVSFAQRNSVKEEIKSESMPISVKVQTIQAGRFEKSLSVSGTIEGENEAVVISETSGKVTAVKAQIGNWLNKGQAIVLIENDLQNAALLQAKSQELAAKTNYEKALADLKRFENLLDQKIATQSDLENARLGSQAAEAQLKGAEAGLIQAQKQFDNTAIKTPINGKLADRYVEEAAMINPGMPVAVMVNNRNMKLKSSVSENEVALLSKNAQAILTVDAVPDKQFSGKLTSIAQKTNNEHTYPVEVVVSNDKDESLKSGMFGRAIVKVAEFDNVIIIPVTAILTDANKIRHVFVNKNGIAQRVNIKVGLEYEGIVQVVNGLNIGDQLIIVGQGKLSDGTKITIIS
jgi:membrane fusion protein, multidrug efflux system